MVYMSMQNLVVPMVAIAAAGTTTVLAEITDVVPENSPWWAGIIATVIAASWKVFSDYLKWRSSENEADHRRNLESQKLRIKSDERIAESRNSALDKIAETNREIFDVLRANAENNGRVVAMMESLHSKFD